ncbi:hypothetical protein DB30_04621 [Enhygromyxa salina]|uniref:JmjC domain-containing protein n=1 Tax=Enhygromyxa salina TaxID=215803 RepID=A0A0C2D7M4_9BACT|nr:cupin domain-containing protein [Enhygromyxa salina]KIG19156.1 hypothetical protein DB30_04621 [Enhygromyxa salina]
MSTRGVFGVDPAAPGWPTQVVRADCQDDPMFAELAALLPDVEAVCALFERQTPAARVSVWHTDGQRMQGAQKLEPRAALAAHRAGATLYFHECHRVIPALGRYLNCVREAVGDFMPSASRVEIFAGVRGSGAHLHFDRDCGLNVQLHGEKRWQIHPPTNTNVIEWRDPVWQRFAWRPDGTARDPQVEPSPTLGPSDAVETVVAGQSLWLPRGLWHTTQVSSERSLALVFVISPASLAARLSSLIEWEIVRDPRLRELCFASLAHASLADLRALGPRIAQLITCLAVDQLVYGPFPDALAGSWALHEDVTLSVDSDGRFHIRSGGDHMSYSIGSAIEDLPWFDRLLERLTQTQSSGPAPVGALLWDCPDSLWPWLEDLFAALSEAGVLERVQGEV